MMMDTDKFKYRVQPVIARSGVCDEAISLPARHPLVIPVDTFLVIPAKAGISSRDRRQPVQEIPAFAGMTKGAAAMSSRRIAARIARPCHPERSEGSCTTTRNPRRQDACATGISGFTLVELLVALAIFLTIMAVVALFFTAAIRTSKQGVQNQQAFELARGAMRLIERDLSRAFTSRDHGDVYSFYGTPIGFTYVGMVNVAGTDAYNLARVTYVIYHEEGGAVAEYENVDGTIVRTYALLRVVEPGIDNLDAYQIDWGSISTLDGVNTLQTVIDNNVTFAGCRDAACTEIAQRSARREIWIRMLAGGDSEVPSAWTTLDQFIDVVPADYVVAENVRYLRSVGFQCRPTQDELVTAMEASGTPIDYDDLLYGDENGNFCARVISDAGTSPIFDPFDPISNPVAPVPNPNTGEQPYFNYWDVGVSRNLVTTDLDDKVAPIAYTFWNDVRNAVSDNIDNDQDGFTDEADEFNAFTVGSPLDARLPLAVTVDFTLFFKSPYLGAPDFNQRFTQRIDLPTGYRRLFKTTAPGP